MQINLYTKPDCPLCDDLKRDLVGLQPEFGFELTEQNILEDAVLWQKFQYLIPVLEIDGHTLLYPPHDWLTLHNTLRAAQVTAKAST
jgi:glutaredoxin